MAQREGDRGGGCSGSAPRSFVTPCCARARR